MYIESLEDKAAAWVTSSSRLRRGRRHRRRVRPRGRRARTMRRLALSGADEGGGDGDEQEDDGGGGGGATFLAVRFQLVPAGGVGAFDSDALAAAAWSVDPADDLADLSELDGL